MGSFGKTDGEYLCGTNIISSQTVIGHILPIKLLIASHKSESIFMYVWTYLFFPLWDLVMGKCYENSIFHSKP